MKSTSFIVKETFPASTEKLYHAWLDSEIHAAMTDGEAAFSDVEGGTFTAWNGYISGKNISFTPDKQIIQSWRTTEFSDQDEK